MKIHLATRLLGAAALAMATGAIAQPTIERTVKVTPGGIYEIVYNSGDNDVYVAAPGGRGAPSASLVRLDGTTLASEGVINLGETGLYGLAINQRTQTLYGTATRTGGVAAVDLATGAIAATISHGERAHVRQVIVDEAANKVYVSVVGAMRGGENPSQIWVIDGATNRIDRVIDVPGITLTGLALDAAHGRIFSTGMSSNDAVVIDLASGSVTARWATGGEGSVNIAYDDAGNRLLVANQGSGDVSILNATDGSLIRKVATGAGALSVAINPAVNQIYVANRGAGTLSVIDATSYDVLANLAVGSAPQTIAIDPATNAVYVTSKTRPAPRPAAGAAPGARPGGAGGPGASGPGAAPGGAPGAQGAGAPTPPRPAAAPTPQPEDPTGDVVTLVRP